MNAGLMYRVGRVRPVDGHLEVPGRNIHDVWLTFTNHTINVGLSAADEQLILSKVTFAPECTKVRVGPAGFTLFCDCGSEIAGYQFVNEPNGSVHDEWKRSTTRLLPLRANSGRTDCGQRGGT